MAALLAGFSNVSFMQFNWSDDFEDTSGVVLPLFGATLALAVRRQAGGGYSPLLHLCFCFLHTMS